MDGFITPAIEEDLKTLIKKALAKQEDIKRMNIYQGKVVNNVDPEKKGRCKVRVFGVFSDNISDDDLPWAIPDFGFIGSDIGSFIVPTNETIVNCYFEDDNIYLPHYTTKVIREDKLKSSITDKNAEYPNTMVFFETDAGDYFSINRQKKTMTFRHSSGLKFTVDASGNTVLDNTETNGTLKISVVGDASISSQGDVTLESGATGKIRLVSGDGTSNFWVPNSIKICPFTGTPHSLVTGLVGN